MRFFKWSVFFLFSFFISWIVISTFSQSPFRASVPVKIVFYQTQSIPIYYFIAVAFTLGLLIGLAIAVYNYISLTARNIKKNRRIRELEANISQNERASSEMPDESGTPDIKNDDSEKSAV